MLSKVEVKVTWSGNVQQRGKHCLIYTNSLSTIVQKCAERVKGGQHLVRNGCQLKWSNSTCFTLVLDFKQSQGNVIWIAHKELILGNTTTSDTLDVGHWTPALASTPGDVNYSRSQSEPDHCLAPFWASILWLPHDQRPWEHWCKEAYSLSSEEDPGFLWKWAITGNSHMCCPRQCLLRFAAYVFTIQPRTPPATSSAGCRTSDHFTVSGSQCPRSEVWAL